MSQVQSRGVHDSRKGSIIAWFLGIYAMLEIVPGLIHFCLPDGGAGGIAGLDLAHNRDTIVGVFAWMGALQIAYGIGFACVALRYRPLVPLFLWMALVERVLMSVAAWVTKPGSTGHHPPEHYLSPGLIPILIACIIVERGRRSPEPVVYHHLGQGQLPALRPGGLRRLADGDHESDHVVARQVDDLGDLHGIEADHRA